MTARQPPRPDGLNRAGKSTRPYTKKRGESAKPEARAASAVAVRTYPNTCTNATAEQVSPDKPLTDKQRLFVKHWAAGETIICASRMAGYNDGASIAYRMVRMPNVLKLYNQEKALYEKASQMTRKKVMDGLLDGIALCRIQADGQGVIAGWRTVGQMCGYFEPVKRKVEVNLTGSVMMGKLNAMSDADLLKVIQQGVTEELLALEMAEENS